MKSKIIFQETQSFVGTWMWYLVLGVTVLPFGGLILAYTQNRDDESLIGLIIAGVVMLGVNVLFIASKLYTTIDQDKIYYRFPPFVNSEKTIQKQDIKEVYVRKYQPIWEYGGWGYRVRLGKGKALNIAGNMGLQIIFADGKQLLIGTQKAEAMERAISQLKEKWDSNG